MAFDESAPRTPLSEQEKVEVLALVDRGEVTVSDAARPIGCSRNHVYQLKRRLAERGTLAFATRRDRISASEREAVLAFARAHPLMGERNLASALRQRRDDPIDLSPSSVRVVLKAVGLKTIKARMTATASV
ncbi:helix-turn-helix domain-containing protein [Amorphoplanes digitatis]|uniref:helix-turn-helix domain-containing protein n=1 Tax=Actinoplanes digitatis TaxID=1868 RepID=UPI0023B220B1|nr:helix-turn-helix domain-containing protein [Actinoplanes digitatis]